MITRGFKRTVPFLALASTIIFTSCQKEELMENQFENSVSESADTESTVVEGQYIVVFKNGSTGLNASHSNDLSTSERSNYTGLRNRLMSDARIPAEELIQSYDGVVNGFAARLSPMQLEALKDNPYVEYIEQDRTIILGKGKKKKVKSSTTTSPSTPVSPVTEPDPNSYKTITPLNGEHIPWNIQRVGYGDGTGKTVWIIDSGVDTDHPDLNIDLSRSASFIYGNTSVEDGHGHGTSVAGVIAAKNNGSGMIGVASNATIVPLRVFDDAGAGTVSRAISAVNHVSNNAKPGDVVNISLGSGISSTLDNAVKAAASKGIFFTIAAGNSGVDCASTSPARVDAPGVYTLSAMDSYNRLWASSNYGVTVDFAAPGVNVTVTMKGGGIGSGANGTSFAAPHVAGILLLRGKVYSQGTITGDKDNTPDPIASVE
ncbi:S8 family serine peptidase [Pontibacter sp. H249]|uniref:S8 family serine peptidase n=1 Tax=Pontibacter sp. H249 TaxID=3133420 RepID=UPI0030BC317F